MSEGCLICESYKKFEIPDDLYNEIIHGNAIIFAGSGISTEKKGVMQTSLYEDISYELGIDSRNSNKTFPELMSLYSNKINGRKKLFINIKKRFDYTKSFGQLKNMTTSFHKELSSIPNFQNIITTNWDTYFEEECGAQPFVIPEDFAFYDIPGRKVFKIHGSINNISTIIATSDDYKKCFKNLNKGVLGANLKLLLATKTIIFIGYSLEDEDFKLIYKFLKKEHKDLLPHAYIVKPSKKISKDYKNFPLSIIETDGTFFLHKIKERLIKEGKILDNEKLIQYFDIFLESLFDIHHNILKDFNLNDYPQLAFTMFYQDGFIDFLTRFKNCNNSGWYAIYDNIYHQYENYEKIKKDKKKNKNYADISYINGYQHGIRLCMILGSNKIKTFKEGLNFFTPYYLYGDNEGINNKDEFIEKLKNQKQHKASHNKALEIIKDGKSIPHHTSFI